MQPALFMTQDEEDAARYWRDREVKVFAVQVLAGPRKRPTFDCIYYARARTGAGAISAVKRGAVGLPKRAEYGVRLAGPRELGCVPTPARGADK